MIEAQSPKRTVVALFLGTVMASGCATVPTTLNSPLAAHGAPTELSVKSRSTRLVYISDPLNNAVFVFDAAGKILSDISTLHDPQGLFVDSSENLWVADTGTLDILVFKKGGKKPIATYNDPVGYPVNVTQCPNGQIYVADESRVPSGGGSVGIYTVGNPSPVGRLNGSGTAGIYYLACDSNDNLFATVRLAKGRGSVDEWVGGVSSGLTQLPIKLGFPGGIRVDERGNLFVNDQGRHRITEYTNAGLPTGHFIPTGQGDVVGIDITRDSHIVAGANILTGEALTWSFPSGAPERKYVLPPSWPPLTPIGIAYDQQ